jgi:NAD(P)H-hydrate repair Nnr-like enzyme with NAD(P)H-hydrate dehydratase domain
MFQYYIYIDLYLTNARQIGRVAVIRGSEDYTGALYFSFIASAELNADIVGAYFSIQHLKLTIPELYFLQTLSCTGQSL